MYIEYETCQVWWYNTSSNYSWFLCRYLHQTAFSSLQNIHEKKFWVETVGISSTIYSCIFFPCRISDYIHLWHVNWPLYKKCVPFQKKISNHKEYILKSVLQYFSFLKLMLKFFGGSKLWYLHYWETKAMAGIFWGPVMMLVSLRTSIVVFSYFISVCGFLFYDG